MCCKPVFMRLSVFCRRFRAQIGRNRIIKNEHGYCFDWG